MDKIRREASERAYAEAVFDLIRRGIISAGYGTRLLGIGMDTMLDELQRHGISVADYSEDELRRELEEAGSDFDAENPSRDRCVSFSTRHRSASFIKSASCTCCASFTDSFIPEAVAHKLKRVQTWPVLTSYLTPTIDTPL